MTLDPHPDGSAPRRHGPTRSLFGVIDRVENGTISGWITAPLDNVLPVVTVDGRPVMRLDYPLDRPDVNRALGLAGDFGFACHASAIGADARVELHAVTDSRTVRLAVHRATVPWLEASFLRQLERARAIASQPDAVVIAYWDGMQNDVGRAKVLYDVVTRRRPALLASYLFDEFGGRTWPLLQSTDTALLTIPWTGRLLYHEAIRAAGIAFDTVWVCKPRFPCFELAAHLATPRARLMLDLDDDEEHFSRSGAAQAKPYGLSTLNLARLLSEAVTARTAASVTLAKDFDARILRHARAPCVGGAPRPTRVHGQVAIGVDGAVRLHKHFLDRFLRRTRAPHPDGPSRLAQLSGKAAIGFIGTAQPHKRLLEAARAIQIFNRSTRMDAVLHVYSDVHPKSLSTDLEAQGAIVKQPVPMAEFYERVEAMDVILTDFPGSGADDEAAARYQIPSEIGDALRMGRPVLVPRGPNVADLADVPGIFLFDEVSFGEALRAALTYRGRIALPEPFTLDGAHMSFATAEAQAEAAPRVEAVLSGLAPGRPQQGASDLPPTLLLIWKQHDAGLYGRRIDQIARSYKRAHPEHRVVILELVNNFDVKYYRNQEASFTSEHRLVLEQMSRKAIGQVDEDGVVIHQIRVKRPESLPDMFERFLLEQRMLPGNTVIALFPIIQSFDFVADLIADYPKIMDVVDNQFSWATKTDHNSLMRQYYAMARMCDRVFFNSDKNRDYFTALGLLPEAVTHKVVPNWYEFPAGYTANIGRRNVGPQVNVVYSGNMNTRIDWNLIAQVAGLSETTRMHLIGAVDASDRDFIAALDRPNIIYHGPRNERDTLHLLETMDLAIMPHKTDAVSTYMNPLKLQMYAAAGLPVVSTDVPGIEPHELLTIAGSAGDFVEAVRRLTTVRQRPQPRSHPSGSTGEYIAEIDALRAAR